MLNSTNIFLIGPMGAGKTTIGKLLAKQLNMDFYDTDIIIEQKTGAPIAWIFDIEGEIGFRNRETSVIKKLCKEKNIILATGGGAILKDENRNLLKNNGWCVFLDLDIEEQWRRLEKTKNRPLIRGENARKKLETLNATRLNLYRQIADFQITSNKDCQEQLIADIRRHYLLQKAK